MKIWTAVFIGFLLGALSVSLLRPISKVHASGPLRIRVYEVEKGGGVDVTGSQMTGFSCIAATPATGPGTNSWSRCFVAITE
jgi:hypothetical protein